KGWSRLIKFDDANFYFVTDSELSKNNIFSDAENAIKAGCKIIQYREKNKSTKDMIEEARQLKEICEGKAILLVDDRADVALVVGADGVHIGQEDIPYETARLLLGMNKIIGLTVHNLEEAIEAEKLGVNYIGLAPIFKTDTKEDAREPIGTKMIETVRRSVSLPIVAVGGINKHNVKDVIDSGADSVVSIYAVLNSDNVYNEVSEFVKIIKEAKNV
ncbi:MAG: thiamine phosphate synthase, partial [Thermoplasmatales archaeon]|nr:thiamine phosphate synthase [Thermoplasmatales archaeon]